MSDAHCIRTFTIWLNFYVKKGPTNMEFRAKLSYMTFKVLGIDCFRFNGNLDFKI